MKKFLKLFLVFIIVLSFTACSNSESDANVEKEINYEMSDITLMSNEDLYKEFIQPLYISEALKPASLMNVNEFYGSVLQNTAFPVNDSTDISYYHEKYEKVSPYETLYVSFDSVYVPREEFENKIISRFNLTNEEVYEYYSHMNFSQEKDAYILELYEDKYLEVGEKYVNKDSIVLISNEDDTFSINFNAQLPLRYINSYTYNIEMRQFNVTINLKLNEEFNSYQFVSYSAIMENESISEEELLKYVTDIYRILNQEFSDYHSFIDNFAAFEALLLTIEDKVFDYQEDSGIVLNSQEVFTSYNNATVYTDIYNYYFANSNEIFKNYILTHKDYNAQTNFFDYQNDYYERSEPIIEVDGYEYIAMDTIKINYSYYLMQDDKKTLDYIGSLYLRKNSETGIFEYYMNSPNWDI